MSLPRLSSRALRLIVAIAWLIALAFSAWVAAEMGLRLTTPERSAALFVPVSDPHQAAQRLATRTPLARASDQTAQAQTEGPAVSQGFELVGIATGFGSDPGFALIKPVGGAVQNFMVGDNLAPGVELVALAPDHVEIQRGSQRERILLSRGSPGAFPAPIIGDPSEQNATKPLNLR